VIVLTPQPVAAALGLGEAVGARPPELDGGVLDARLLALGGVDDLGLEAAPLAPADVHPGQHLRPVLGVDAALAAVDDDDRVGPVVGPAERGLQLELADGGGERRRLRLDLAGHRRVLGRQLGEVGEIVRAAAQAPPVADAVAQVAEGAHGRLGAAGVVPEAGLGALRLEVLDLPLDAGQVKDASRGFPASAAGRPGSSSCRS